MKKIKTPLHYNFLKKIYQSKVLLLVIITALLLGNWTLVMKSVFVL